MAPLLRSRRLFCGANRLAARLFGQRGWPLRPPPTTGRNVLFSSVLETGRQNRVEGLKAIGVNASLVRPMELAPRAAHAPPAFSLD